jgi:hypothetical protein
MQEKRWPLLTISSQWILSWCAAQTARPTPETEMTTMTKGKLTAAQLSVLTEIAKKGFVRGKTAQLRDLRAAGLIVYGAVWPVIAKDNYATLTEIGDEMALAYAGA